jgi:hypothetical protein
VVGGGYNSRGAAVELAKVVAERGERKKIGGIWFFLNLSF